MADLQWTPVEAGLPPEDGKYVLVIRHRSHGRNSWEYIDRDKRSKNGHSGWYMTDGHERVTHWMTQDSLLGLPRGVDVPVKGEKP